MEVPASTPTGTEIVVAAALAAPYADCLVTVPKNSHLERNCR